MNVTYHNVATKELVKPILELLGSDRALTLYVKNSKSIDQVEIFHHGKFNLGFFQHFSMLSGDALGWSLLLLEQWFILILFMD